MDIVIAEADAIRTYRLARRQDATIRVEPAPEDPTDFSYGSSERFRACVLAPLIELGIIDEGSSVHLRFPHRKTSRRVRGITGHLCTSKLPQGACWRVIPEDRKLAQALSSQGIRIFVDCPQLCVVYVAAQAQRTVTKSPLSRRVVPMARTIALGSEFCGTYALGTAKALGSSTAYGLEPLISVVELREFLSEAYGVDGLMVARGACEVIAGGQASPAEVALHAGLVLRPGMGGFHFERPATNQPLLPNESLQALLKHQNITPDLYWERYGLVIEYDGAVHFSADGVREDKRRVFDYQAMELVVLPATAEDIRTVDSFDAFARTVSRVMERVDGPSLRRRVNKILADKDARICRSLLLSGIQTAL